MKTIADIIKNKDSPLAKLINKTKSSQDLEMIFRTALDVNLAKNCHFANYKDSVLTIIVPNTAWATRLRYAIPDIIKQLKIQPEFKNISNIRYAINAPKTPAVKAKKPSNKLSSNNETLWQKTLAELRKKCGIKKRPPRR